MTSAHWSGSNSSALEHRREILVGKVRAVHALVERPGVGLARWARAVCARHGVPIPSGVVRAPWASRPPRSRHRIDAPVDEDAELGIAEPRRRGPAIERVPRGLILPCVHKGRSKHQAAGEHERSLQHFCRDSRSLVNGQLHDSAMGTACPAHTPSFGSVRSTFDTVHHLIHEPTEKH